MLIGTTRLTTSIRELVIIPLDQLFGCCALPEMCQRTWNLHASILVNYDHIINQARDI